MVKVTDKDYYLDGYMQKIADAIIKRITKKKQDCLLIFDGDEGSGKTNAAIALAYYVAYESKRPFDHNNVFFDIEKMVEFAATTEKQVIIWDEAALGGLAAEWQNKKQRQLLKLVMTARKKRHFLIFCIPKYHKLNEYLVVDRAMGLVHIYENKDEEQGNFMWFSKEKKERLWEDFKKSRRRRYWAHKMLHGCFTWVLPQLIDEKAYEEKKDKAIMSIMAEPEKKKTENPMIGVIHRLLSRNPEIPASDVQMVTGLSESYCGKIMKAYRDTVSKKPLLLP